MDFHGTAFERSQIAAIAETALTSRDKAPDFLLPDDAGKLVWLRELLKERPVVLTFIHGSWCTPCVDGLKAIGGASGAAWPVNRVFVAVTPETSAYPRELKRRLGAEYLVLSDVDCGAGLEFGVVSILSDATKQRFLANGLDLGSRHGSRAWMLPMCSTFVVGMDGVISAAHGHSSGQSWIRCMEVELQRNVPSR